MIKRISAALLAACLMLLCSCGGKTDQTVSWQQALPNSGATVALSNCTVTEGESKFYMQEGGQAVTLAIIYADNIPVLTVSNADASQVHIRYATPYEDGMRLYDYTEPYEKTDYILTELADGSLQYRIDTIYYYYITVETTSGADSFLLECTREI